MSLIYGPASYYTPGWVYPRDRLRAPFRRAAPRGPRSALAVLLLPAPVVVAIDFWAALLAWLNADPSCSAAFPGGFVQGVPAPDQPFPYCGVDQTDPWTTPSREDDGKRAGFRVYAHSDDDCASAAAVLVARLLDSPHRAPITFAVPYDPRTWAEAGTAVVGPPSMPKFIGYASDGLEVWRADRTILFDVTADA